MRHGKKVNHLSRQTGHRKAMLANMACSLIEHKRINTTTAKAKALKQFVEPLITKSKEDTTHNRRIVFSYLISNLFIILYIPPNRRSSAMSSIQSGTSRSSAGSSSRISWFSCQRPMFSCQRR